MKFSGLCSLSVVLALLHLAHGKPAAPGSGADAPQPVVECNGWHALCSLADDCKIDGQAALCDCWKVKERHLVVTIDIQDEQVRNQTFKTCTTKHPCKPGEAPVCKAIADGTFTVDGQKYEWVSTFSYRGWCEGWKPVKCDVAPWADCMTYPCTENANPKDPERPLQCKCVLKTTEPFVGNGGCTSAAGEVISTINAKLWDFVNHKFTLPMPGYEYVKGACDAIHSG